MINSTRDGHCYMGSGLRVRCDSDMQWPACSRALLEHLVRGRVASLPGVDIRARTGAGDLLCSDDGRRVTGVTLEDGQALPAALVVDASGRTARSVTWLKSRGMDTPPTDTVTIDIGYASRVVKSRADGARDWKFAMVSGDPPLRLGVAFPMEGERWIVTLAGYHGNHAGDDDAGFLDFARSLPSPAIADLVAGAEALEPVVIHRLPSNQWRHVERVASLPAGLVMLGDAVCSFNPIYGQGMSSAAMQADALATVLAAAANKSAAPHARFPRTSPRLAARKLAPRWQMATGGYFTLPGTTGPRPPGAELMGKPFGGNMQRIMLAGQVSETVAVRVLEITNLQRPATALFAPSMVMEVMRAARKAARAASARTDDAGAEGQ
jgi:hypothetical protein